jgi:hypothetical protein
MCRYLQPLEDILDFYIEVIGDDTWSGRLWALAAATDPPNALSAHVYVLYSFQGLNPRFYFYRCSILYSIIQGPRPGPPPHGRAPIRLQRPPKPGT